MAANRPRRPPKAAWVAICAFACILACAIWWITETIIDVQRQKQVAAKLGIVTDRNPGEAIDLYLEELFTIGNDREQIFDTLNKLGPEDVVLYKNLTALNWNKGATECYQVAFGRGRFRARYNDRIFCFDDDQRLIVVTLVIALE